MSVQFRPSKLALVFGAAALGATALLGSVAVSAESMDHSAHMQSPAKFAFGGPGKAADVDRTIHITALDISYDVTSLKVKAGETVRFVITNKSEVDHDFTLGDSRTQAEHRSEMAEMGDMASGHAHQADANAVFVKAGETKTLIWRFGRPTKIEFGCNVPGHYEAGMKGVIDVI